MKPQGLIAWMATHPVAANLVMVVALLGGLIGLAYTKQEVFPEFDLDMITVSVPYPGATPEDVEQGIVLAVEEAVVGLDGVKRVSSTANEGTGTVQLELLLGADAESVLADVKNAVDSIRTFPEDAERPVMRVVTRRREVVSLIVTGPEDPRVLHDLAERVRREMLASDEITQVEISGVRPVEIAVEIPRRALDAHGLTLAQVAGAIHGASVELPGGSVKAAGGEVNLRVADRRTTAAGLAEVIVAAGPDGELVHVGDLATPVDGYAETDQAWSYNGSPAVRVTAYRVGDESPLRISKAVRNIQADLDTVLPDSVQLTVWDDSAEILRARIDLLLKNAAFGLVLVWISLAVFLELRLAFWIAMGLPFSYLGIGALMPAMGASINMITLFALIVVLGMVVDDAIVVGENIFEHRTRGEPPLEAAIHGTREMAMPVAFASLTTIVAFAPLLFVPGMMGKVFFFIPVMVIGVLALSLLESFAVLPMHLAHARRARPGSLVGRLNAGSSWFLDGVRERILLPLLRFLLEYRGLTLAWGVATLVVVGGATLTGWIPFNFFPDIEGDTIEVTARLPHGTPVERTAAVGEALERAAHQAVADLGEPADLEGMYTRLGEGERGASGSHLVSVEVELVPVDDRQFTTRELADAWRAATPDMAGVESLSFEATSGPSAGMAVDAQLSHPDIRVLAEASDLMTEALRGYEALADVRNAWSDGKPQLDYTLTPAGRSLGLTSDDLGRQLRGAFYGAEAVREQRGRDELRIMVRLPREERDTTWTLEQLMVQTPAGPAPLSHVADATLRRSPTEIEREDGARVVHVTARLAPGVRSSREVLESVKEEVVPGLRARYPELRVEFTGSQRERKESVGALLKGLGLALVAIYGMLAIPFRSWAQPAVIMVAIPFGIVGAVLGHVVMGATLSIMSLMGIVALSGVVVNDSLVLIDAANQRRREGASPKEAVLGAAGRRLRPILLTSMTTFLGLAPMILETSVQAQFLVPMAVSLGFGVLFATVVILLLVPVVYSLVEEVRDWLYSDVPKPEVG